MGTTVTLAVVRGDRLIIVHVGDSRAYMIAGEHGWISQITDDHSFVEALLASGHITSAQAARHPMRSVLYRALGQTEAMGGADFYTRDVRAGDRVILASDGLMRHVTDEEIARVAMLHEDPAEIAQTLIDMTNQRGAEDNVSVVALVISGAEDALVPLEKLVPIPGEQEPDHATHDDAHKTGEILNPTLRQTHNPESAPPDSPGDS
jgi:protein phosphatase